MILEHFDNVSRVLRLDLEGEHGVTLPSRLSSLVMVACDCGISSVECLNTGLIRGPGSEPALEIIERNSLFSAVDGGSSREIGSQDGFWLINRDEGLLCLGGPGAIDEYSIFVSPDLEGAGKASVFTHILSCVLGFSSFVSFEARFSVFELLTRDFGRQERGEGDKWVRLVFSRERGGARLAVTIVDRDVTARKDGGTPSLDEGLPGSGLFRLLGAETARRISSLLSWEREGSDGRMLLFRDPDPSGDGSSENGEKKMVRFDMLDSDAGPTATRRVRLEGALDSVGALLIEKLTADMISEGAERLELDFERVSFVSSAGVGILLGMVSMLRGRGTDVSFVKVPGKVASVFRLLNLEGYFNISGGRDRVTA